ncbi:hypothetical protein [Egicoccus sp. AB-alg2]|uniref:hypothetical protein n=1 Tax=Egicoccus sp. AB-alg2 TaxID=3242693 RepID=UPI00359D80CD
MSGDREGVHEESRDDASTRPPHEAEDALVRLEDALLALPFDRALPDLDDLLRRAGVPLEVVRRDERARKLLHEAIVARPFASLDAVHRVRTEVELLTLEVEVLTDRLAQPDLDVDAFRRVAGRLYEVRDRLEELRGEL